MPTTLGKTKLLKASEGHCVSCASLWLCCEAEGLTVHSCSLQHHKEVEPADNADQAIQMFQGSSILFGTMVLS